ncbi:uncharacterized protein LOC130674789 [Microplitis mediator]|uniref:uncharacterized protein LOC130674789 n=1 Tax=Microplitis mediator TaxID=375433 RepID=UPI002554E719|nr:uncharacterized protein LOC130674789 [Microplitis mediator]
MKVYLIVLTLAVFDVLGTTTGYPSRVILSNGSAVTNIRGVYEDSIAAASEVHSEDYNDSDDSDIYMEPDGAETENRESEQATKPPATLSIDEESLSAATTVADPGTEVHKAEIGLTAQEDKSLEQESQNFFPSFAELFANHRLTYNEQQQQQRYRPNRFLGYFQRDRNNAYQTSASTSKDTQHPLLGSGNFGVIRGGTYYPEEKENDEYNVDESLYNPYYSSSSAARGRSTNYYRNPKPQPVRAGDFFSNFRDFADITAPPKSSFSHLSVVYANRNGTKSSRAEGTTEPRNIIETLKMLEEDNIEDDNMTTIEAPMKKLSQGKRKLLKMKKYHESKARKFRMTVEPLLALS